jgi:hypothetical protein
VPKCQTCRFANQHSADTVTGMLKRFWNVLCGFWFVLVMAIHFATSANDQNALIFFSSLAVAPFVFGHVFYRLFCFVLTGDFFPAELKPRA